VRRLVLLDKGRFEGNLEAQTLAVHEGAQLNGAVNTGGAGAARPPLEEPAKADAQRGGARAGDAKPAGGAVAG
jgi:cytoskeletal protein CcmA (bactofilin family)